MSATVTFRLDPETARILKELTRGKRVSKSQAIREALRTHAEHATKVSTPSAWEVYSSQKIPPAPGPKRDRARRSEELMREILLAKRRNHNL